MYMNELLVRPNVLTEIAKENDLCNHWKKIITNTPDSLTLPLEKNPKVPTGLSPKLYDKSDGLYRTVGRVQNFTYKLVRRLSDNKLYLSMINATNISAILYQELLKDHKRPCNITYPHRYFSQYWDTYELTVLLYKPNWDL